ncbi:MAG: hypothetical protein COB09_16915 [Thalassobium sp.]|nr:MAG: hypothetical protein COB09_16915 [Thalassobium sp.]
MDKPMTDLEFLRETTPRSLAVINSIRGNIADLHPVDKIAFLNVISQAVTDLWGIHKAETVMSAIKPPEKSSE